MDTSHNIAVTKINTKIKGRIAVRSTGKPSEYSYKHSLMFNNERNKLIVDIVKRMDDKKIIVVTYGVTHAKLLYLMLSENSIKCDWMSGRKKMCGKCDVLIVVGKLINQGLFRNCIDCIIIVNPLIRSSSCREWCNYAIGGNNMNIYHLVDNGSLSIRNWSKQEELYKNAGMKIIC